MLKSLQIRNYVLIDSLDVTFPEGLVIISGQTGAGKSILLGALSLLLGSKADSSVIGGDADSCVVEAVFVIPESDTVLKGILEENDVEAEDGELIVRRVVNRSGRSRSFINDSPVSIQILQSISTRLVDIHSQHQTLLLSDKSFQLSMLDHFAGNESLLASCANAYKTFRSLQAELSEATSRLLDLQEKMDYVKSRWQRLDDARLQAGELEALEAERKQLANAEEIKENLGGVAELFDPSDPNSDSMPLSSTLKEAQKMLEKAARFVPEAAALAGRIDSARTELDDILEDVSTINDRVELSQERLEAVDDRLSLLYDLMKSYSCSSLEELIAKRDELSESVQDSAALEARVAELKKLVASAESSLKTVCESLHKVREKTAPEFSAAITESVRSLEMEYAVFDVELTPTTYTATGSDSIRFLFSASGTKPTDVAKCASGGEMSRLMLCLKAMMAKFVNMPTLIFDEIDTGVSGSVADKMGRMICAMGNDMQVFAITHLPQVAAKGSAHYLVEKGYDETAKAKTTVRLLSGQERVMEIARMLSGSVITPAAVENAKSLLSI